MITVVDELIDLGHPNRWGWKLIEPLALVFHFTNNDRPGMDDAATGRYFGRRWHGTKEKPLEDDGYGNPAGPFGYGSAHFGCDKDSITRYIPEDEVAWHVGDRAADHVGDPMWEPIPLTNGFDGYKEVAHTLFHNFSNNYTIGIEIANNQDGNWDMAVQNAIAWARDYLQKHNRYFAIDHCLPPRISTVLEPEEILILRHNDLTGKICPKPFVNDFNAWIDVLKAIAA